LTHPWSFFDQFVFFPPMSPLCLACRSRQLSPRIWMTWAWWSSRSSIALFKVNTGCREQEVCSLRWDWEIDAPDPDTSVFLIPEEWIKNGEERLVVLNKVAKSVVESVRGQN